MVRSYLFTFSGFSGGTPHGHAADGVVSITKTSVNTVVSRRRCTARGVARSVVGIDRVVALSVVGVTR